MRRSRLNGQAFVWCGLLAFAIVVFPVTFADEWPVTARILILFLAAFMGFFAWLFYGLFTGLYLLPERIAPQWKVPWDASVVPDAPIGDDPGSFVLSVLLWIIVGIVLSVALSLFLAAGWWVLTGLYAFAYWIALRLTRLILTQRKTTRGKMRIAALYAVAFSLPLAALVAAFPVVVELISRKFGVTALPYVVRAFA